MKPQHIVSWVCLLAAAAAAQPLPSTVGELLDRGGSRLTGDQVRELLAGARVTGYGPRRTEATFEARVLADGSMRSALGVARVPANGQWRINEKGQFCWSSKTQQGEHYGVCTFWFRLGEHYFASETGDRNAAAQQRMVGR